MLVVRVLLMRVLCQCCTVQAERLCCPSMMNLAWGNLFLSGCTF